MNDNIKRFIDKVALTLESENAERQNSNQCKLDIPFMIAPLSQQLIDDKYKELVSDICKYSYSLSYYEDTSDGYTNGYIDIYLIKTNVFEDDFNDGLHSYRIEFLYSERYWGDCQCQPQDKDYRNDKDCCGHGCDWVAPSIKISKIIDIGSCEWNGDEHDYWEFEENFYKTNKELAEEKDRKEKENRIEFLKEQIYQSQLELVNLRKELGDVGAN